MGHAILERVLLFGTRSADHIRASGHCGCIAMEVSPFIRKQAGYMAAPERFADKSDSSCTAGAVHTWPLAPDHVLMDRGRYRSRSGHVGASA